MFDIRKGIYLTFVVIFVATPLWPQEFRGTISGAVTDPASAVIPGAQVLIEDATTGGRFTTVSNAEGLYTVPFLPPGVYRLTVEKPAFKRYVRDGVQVNAAERIEV